MNALVKQSMKIHHQSNQQSIKDTQDRARIRVKECFGEYANSNLVELERPCHFRIKDTQWNLVYGFCDGFTIWHKDYPQDGALNERSRHENFGKYNAWQILDMKTLGRSLESVIKIWGL